MAVSISYVMPGTIGDFTDLQRLVARYMDRDDLAADIANFVAIVEAEANRVLRTVNQERKAIWAISSETFSLPPDFRRLRKIHIEGEPDRPLEEISPVAAPMIYDGAQGTPNAYWIEGRVMTLAPPPAEETTFRVTYYVKIEPLTADSPVNWLMEEHPDIYVWGVLREAAAFIRDPEAYSFAEGRFNGAIVQLQQESRNDRHGGGPLVPVGVQQLGGCIRC
ncbi:hypothetical protein M2336_001666 [Sphingobium sp. B1D7B]|uniref:phage adaptor protein n=1 Tax=Sphingobium sp. B1D7B TaxID=2940578 RepID=UPI0022249698|nr:hypothetical protein [Sphingobium sp. B1D7B]MCW2405037.1 hypothetical protein [Sphingobium sp. B1D7B]